MAEPSFLYIAGFLVGSLIGSFLNVCIVRIPEGQSIVRPRSRCPHCGHPVRAYDNIPILSYLILKGRCRDCRAPISFQYPVVELLSGLLAMACVAKFSSLGLAALWFLSFICPLIVISFIDLKTLLIPDKISLPFILVGLVVHSAAAGFQTPLKTLLDSLIGIFLGAGILFLIALVYQALQKREGLGMGDVKLAAMIGAFLGWKAVLIIFVLSSFIGSIVGIVLMVAARKNLKSPLPFGPFLALGAVLQLFFGRQILLTYFDWVQKGMR